jgi:hypothetical protein
MDLRTHGSIADSKSVRISAILILNYILIIMTQYMHAQHAGLDPLTLAFYKLQDS